MPTSRDTAPPSHVLFYSQELGQARGSQQVQALSWRYLWTPPLHSLNELSPQQQHAMEKRQTKILRVRLSPVEKFGVRLSQVKEIRCQTFAGQRVWGSDLIRTKAELYQDNSDMIYQDKDIRDSSYQVKTFSLGQEEDKSTSSNWTQCVEKSRSCQVLGAPAS
ncbi:hypothetical protein RRG08_054974 [Elysia crispata]|uniref:Uncharacterized protein n=1 Tax=Elysia crispata TaxID=231223 RepID=A0AAE1ASF4_9GAST|nr:hypothetical protein RRG08_054974 [Elysia crispata]